MLIVNIPLPVNLDPAQRTHLVQNGVGPLLGAYKIVTEGRGRTVLHF